MQDQTARSVHCDLDQHCQQKAFDSPLIAADALISWLRHLDIR